jgi:hypothetical protein
LFDQTEREWYSEEEDGSYENGIVQIVFGGLGKKCTEYEKEEKGKVGGRDIG